MPVSIFFLVFMSTGGLVDANGNPISGTVFLGIPGKPATARAVTVLGSTGRIREKNLGGRGVGKRIMNIVNRCIILKKRSGYKKE